MIFVTVGEYEQNFDRLIEYIDDLVEKNIIKEEIFIQTGNSDYIPKNCDYESILTNKEMLHYINESRIVITYGSISGVMLPFQLNKIPIVVPRQSEFGEYIDNSQVKFTKKLEQLNKIIPIYDIKDLKKSILNYSYIIKKMDYKNVTTNFIRKISEICIELVKEKNEVEFN